MFGWSPVGVGPAAAAVQQPEAVCLITSSPDVTTQTDLFFFFLHRSLERLEHINTEYV